MNQEMISKKPLFFLLLSVIALMINCRYTLTHWRLVEHLTIYSYSSCGVVLSHDVDIENVVVGVVAAAAGRDNDEIRYGSWKFGFADCVLEGGSEGFGYCETVAKVLVCNDCCCCSIKRAPAMALEQQTKRYRSSDRLNGFQHYYCSCS